jgi:hypothetical protein
MCSEINSTNIISGEAPKTGTVTMTSMQDTYCPVLCYNISVGEDQRR